MSTDLLLALAAVALVAGIAYRVVSKRRTDRRFGVHLEGSRDGWIHVRCSGFVAIAFYEVGGTVDLIVHRRHMRTLDGKGLSPEQRDAAIQRLHDWGRARGTSVVVED